VMSPPGNGPDCYRTWEAIYLGAVPIVLRSTLAVSLAADLPIWVVDSWEEVFDATDTRLSEKHLAIKEAPDNQTFFPTGSLRSGILNQPLKVQRFLT